MARCAAGTSAITWSSPNPFPEAALGRLRELRAADSPVVVVMARSAMSAAPAAEFLAHARTVAPAAERVLVVPRGGPAAPSLRVPVPLVADR